MNARYRRKISRMVKQMLRNEEEKVGDEKWSKWRKDRETETSTAERESAGGNCNPWSKGGVPSIKAGQKSREENSDVQGHSDVLSGAGR